MKISELISQSTQILSDLGVGSAKLDSIILLSFATSYSKEKIIFNPDLTISKEHQEIFLTLFEKRKQRIPISQIINKREFYGLDFFVTSAVLDPRNDSETLVETAIEIIEKRKLAKDQIINILELCVGSGCLTISLVKNLSNIAADVCDIDEEALKICKINIDSHQLADRIKIFKSDLFAQIDNKKYHLIIANPPYIASSEIDNLQPEVKLYEPRIALDGGADGLFFYRKISEKAQYFLQENGLIILEIGFGQKDSVIDIFKKNGFALNKIKKDLSSIDRVLVFEKNNFVNSFKLS